METTDATKQGAAGGKSKKNSTFPPNLEHYSNLLLNPNWNDPNIKWVQDNCEVVEIVTDGTSPFGIKLGVYGGETKKAAFLTASGLPPFSWTRILQDSATIAVTCRGLFYIKKEKAMEAMMDVCPTLVNQFLTCNRDERRKIAAQVAEALQSARYFAKPHALYPILEAYSKGIIDGSMAPIKKQLTAREYEDEIQSLTAELERLKIERQDENESLMAEIERLKIEHQDENESLKAKIQQLEAASDGDVGYDARSNYLAILGNLKGRIAKVESENKELVTENEELLSVNKEIVTENKKLKLSIHPLQMELGNTERAKLHCVVVSLEGIKKILMAFMECPGDQDMRQVTFFLQDLNAIIKQSHSVFVRNSFDSWYASALRCYDGATSFVADHRKLEHAENTEESESTQEESEEDDDASDHFDASEEDNGESGDSTQEETEEDDDESSSGTGEESDVASQEIRGD